MSAPFLFFSQEKGECIYFPQTLTYKKIGL